MSCNNPQCTSCNSDQEDECPDTVPSAAKLAVYTDSCKLAVVPSEEGVLASDGDSFEFTDGSESKRPITMRPQDVNGFSAVFGRNSKGHLKEITGSESDVLQMSGGLWTPRPIGVARLSFPAAGINPALVGNAPIWVCGPNETKILGTTTAENESVAVINDIGEYTFITWDAFAAIMLKRICSVSDNWDQTSCINGILGCTDNGIVKIAPVANKSLKAIATGTSACWGLSAASDSTDLKKVFRYTGGDQPMKVPSGLGIVAMDILIWGAGSSLDGDGVQMSTSPAGGVGGFTKLRYPVTEGAEFIVVVGGSNGDNTSGVTVYGHAGNMSSDRHNHAGGGLSGVFSGSSAVSASDAGRAIGVAGGGGAPGRSNPAGANAVLGGPGNTPTSGGQSTMKGADATPGQTTGSGGGGGGYNGGRPRALGGYGGSGFVSTLASNTSIEYSADGATLPPGTSEEDYIATIGTSRNPGMVVVKFITEL